MALFTKNRRFYLVPLLKHKASSQKIFDKRKNLIGQIKTNRLRTNITVTEKNGVVSLRLKKLGSSVRYNIEDHFGNTLGRVGVSKIPSEKIYLEDKNGHKILFSRGVIGWSYTIRNSKHRLIAEGTTTHTMFGKKELGIEHEVPSFVLSVRPHHPDSRFLLAIFIMLLKNMRTIRIEEYHTIFI